MVKGGHMMRPGLTTAATHCGVRAIVAQDEEREVSIMAYELPPLPYDYTALEPHIDEQTMRIHHDKHHNAYVTNLNAALEGVTNLQGLPIEQLLRQINQVPEAKRTAVRNNGGGHANHTLFWQIMGPGGGGQPA